MRIPPHTPAPAFGSRPLGTFSGPPSDPPPEFLDEPPVSQSTRPEPLPFPKRRLGHRLTDEERTQRDAAKARRDEIKAWDRKRWQLIETIQRATGSIHLRMPSDPYARMQDENALDRMDGKPPRHPELNVISSREELSAYADLSLDRFRKQPQYRPGSAEAYLEELSARDN